MIRTDTLGVTSIWAFKEQLQANNIGLELFYLFEQMMEQQGIITRIGSLIDASFVDVPRQRNTREENEKIKEGSVPEEWLDEENENKLEQKDVDARWTKSLEINKLNNYLKLRK